MDCVWPNAACRYVDNEHRIRVEQSALVSALPDFLLRKVRRPQLKLSLCDLKQIPACINKEQS